MARQSQSRRFIRFGVFEADLELRELRKRGIKLRVHEQTFQLLTALLERPGEVVTREELRQRLWPDDTFVDFDHGINTAVKKLREALGDTADNPRFVETIARRGYMFLAPVHGAVFPVPEAIAEGRQIAESTGEVPPVRRHGREVFGWALAAVLSLAVVAIWWHATRQASQPLMRVNVDLPGYVEREWGADVSISPDGSRIVYTGRDADGTFRLFTRTLDQEQVTPLIGAENNANTPFFSSNGRSVGFFGLNKLRTISLKDGRVAELCDVGMNLGGSWGDDGAIIVARNPIGGLSRIPAGGAVQALTELKKDEVSHRWPQVLPRDQAVLFTTRRASGGYEERTIDVQSLRTGERKTLVRGGFYGRYVATGHLLYARPGVLYAAPMDLKRLELTGPAVQVVDGVATKPAIGSAQVNVTLSGMLAYLRGNVRRPNLVWLDHFGQTEPLRAAAAEYGHLRFSPDGNRIAITVGQSGNVDVWVYEWKRDVMTRLTSAPGVNTAPVWTPDGKHIVFTSQRHGGAANLYWIRADGAGEAIRLTESKNIQFPYSFSPDGRLAFTEQSPDTKCDIWTLPLEDVGSDHPKPAKPEPFLATQVYESWPMISPDGRWMAYESNESGNDEVYVRSFPGPGGKWRISTKGDGEPVWSRKRPELFYHSSEGMMVVSYTVSGDTFHANKPELWARKTKLSNSFDLAPDGKRFAIVQEVETEQKDPPQLTLLLNFFDELRRRVPAGDK